MEGILCWLVALVVLVGGGFGLYYLVQVLGAQALKKEEAERAELAEARRQKRIAAMGFDPMEKAAAEEAANQQAATARAAARQSGTPAAPAAATGTAGPTGLSPEAEVEDFASDAVAGSAAPGSSAAGSGRAAARPAADPPALILLNNVQRELNRPQLHQQVRDAWDVNVPAAGVDPTSGETIEVPDTDHARMSVGGFDFLLTQASRGKVDLAGDAHDRSTDPQLRLAAETYHSWLSIGFAQMPADIDDALAYALLGKLTLQLIASDSLALLVPGKKRLVPLTPGVRAALASDDPLGGM